MSISVKTKGFIFAALAAASYGTNPVFAKPLYADGMNTDSVLLMRYLLAILLMLVMMVWNVRVQQQKGNSSAWKEAFSVSRHNVPQLIIMGFLMAMSSLTLFVSYHYMPVGIASTLLFVYPILVAVIMTLCYGEHLSWLVLLCLLMATGGIALLCPIEGNISMGNTRISMNGDFMLGFLIVMLSSFSYAIYLVGLNKTRLRTVASMPVTLYVLMSGSLLFVGRIMFISEFTVPQHSIMWLNLLGLGFFPTVVSLVCTAKAIQCIGSTQTALMGALEPVTAVILGCLILGETVSIKETIGMLLILVSVTVVVSRRRK